MRSPVPILLSGNKSLILTNTNYQQLFSPSGFANLFFNESVSNPYVYGWDGDDLFFKDSRGNNYKLLAGEQKPEQIDLEDPQFIRQEIIKNECDKANSPGYQAGSEEIAWELCYSVTQGDVTIEAWPYESPNSLALGARHLVILKGTEKMTISESRDISDLVISENGNYLAITAARPLSYPGSFEPTDIHIIKL